MSEVNDMNKQVIEEFRANDGKVGGMFESMTLLLLHTTGAKSGAHRINPMVTLKDGDRYLVIASKAGAPSHPDWYHNVVAHPDVRVEVGTEKFEANATIVPEPERSELYAKISAQHPQFAEYQQKTTRVIPVVALSRV